MPPLHLDKHKRTSRQLPERSRRRFIPKIVLPKLNFMGWGGGGKGYGAISGSHLQGLECGQREGRGGGGCNDQFRANLGSRHSIWNVETAWTPAEGKDWSLGYHHVIDKYVISQVSTEDHISRFACGHRQISFELILSLNWARWMDI
jgi:hypothetical protein